MFVMPCLPASVGCLAVLMAVTIAPAPVAAADWQRSYLEPAVQAWMGVVTLLADDGEREEKKGDRDDDRDDDNDKKEEQRGECKGECEGTCAH
ncbi:MAG: hypothetical protein ACKO1M_12055, partial [Planctomycetota bacterium]